MHISEYLDMEELKQAMEDKLINARFSVEGQVIYNYSNAAMYTPGAWDIDAVRKCRGLITDSVGRVKARPFRKFFNHGQAEAGELRMDAPVEVTDKADGSLAVLHYDQMDQPRVATRGSFESEQAHHATKLLWTKYPELKWDWRYITPLAEIIYPENRIVIDNGDTDDLVLLGGVNVETGDYYGPTETADIIGWTGPVTEIFEYKTLHEALMAPPRAGKEGMCVRYLDQPHIVKIKYFEYVALHKVVFGLSEKSIWQHYMDGGNLESLLEPLPDELHDWATKVATDLCKRWDDIRDKAYSDYEGILNIMEDKEDRREFAAFARTTDYPAFQFMLLDGKSIDMAALKTLKPKGNVPAKEKSEDVA